MFSKIELDILKKNINKNILIVGYNNDILKNSLKDFLLTEFKSNNEREIVEYLTNLKNKEYDFIIFNFILSDFYRIDIIIKLLVEKSNCSIIKFINKKIENKIVKKKRINKIIKCNKIIIIKKFFVKNNFCFSLYFLKFFCDYSIYFIKKDYLIMNYSIVNNKIINTILLKIKKLVLLIFN